MPAFTLRPNGQGTFSDWTLGAGASKPAAASDQNDGTFVFDPATAGSESYTLDNLPATAGAISGALTWHLRGNKALGGVDAGTHAFLRLDGFHVTSGFSPGLPVGSIEEQTATFATPPGGGVWTPAKVNALEIGVYNGLSVTFNFHELWLTGTYTATTGGLGLILTMSLAPILASPIYAAQVEKLLRSMRLSG